MSTRRGSRPLLILWASWLVLMGGANLATPLYAVYAERFGFSSLVLTLIFATYAVVLVPALVLFGRLSDRFGRRPLALSGRCPARSGRGPVTPSRPVASTSRGGSNGRASP